jgi:hypothetical protein
MTTMEIKHRHTGDVLFSADLPAEHDGAGIDVQIGVAVKLAVKARANLTGADLTGANLSRANLTDADLARADLTGANLTGADLTGAYLARADLTGANLARAYLAGAYLTRANLTGAYLAGAYLTGAYLAGAKAVIDGGTPDGWRCVGWVRDGVLRVHVGCRDKTIPEGREYWSGKPDRREVLAALDYIEAVAAARGWVNGGEAA